MGHLHVHRGGQAVVGTVTTKGQDPGVGDVGNDEALTPCKAEGLAEEWQSPWRFQRRAEVWR